MTEIATIDWFEREGGTSVFSENTAIFSRHSVLCITKLREKNSFCV